jgi:hypothetical protein
MSDPNTGEGCMRLNPQSTRRPDFGELPALYLPLLPAWELVETAARKQGRSLDALRSALAGAASGDLTVEHGAPCISVDDLNAALVALPPSPEGRPTSGCGVPLRFVPQPSTRAVRAARKARAAAAASSVGAAGSFYAQGKSLLDGDYQARQFLKGEVLTREANWHDLFNALCFLSFPRTKAVLNARHFWAADERIASLPWGASSGDGRRTPEQDYLTHFDEGGVIVASSDPTLLEALRGRRWRELFLDARARLPLAMEFFVFGHGIHESFLTGYRRQHALGLAVEVDADFHSQPLGERLARLDAAAAEALQCRSLTCDTAVAFPVPVLGYPGWVRENEQPTFYDHPVYFRP